MLKKIILGVLLTTVIGAGGTALAYNMTTKDTGTGVESQELLAIENEYVGEDNVEQSSLPVPGQEYPVIEGAEGDPWGEVGTITEIDDFGFQFTLQNGESVYVELGPPDYWQNQGVELQAGQSAIVDGSINEGMIHAFQVLLAEGQILQIRTEEGQPLWSGGISNGQVRMQVRQPTHISGSTSATTPPR